MKADFTAIIEVAAEGGFWAICPEVPGANGQGETVEETEQNMFQAIKLLAEDQNLGALQARITPMNRHPETESGKHVGKEIW